jgi:hypothetical protein
MEKLKRQLAEAEAALEARKKPPEDVGPRIVGEGLVIDEWVHFLFAMYLLFFYLSHLELANRHACSGSNSLDKFTYFCFLDRMIFFSSW